MPLETVSMILLSIKTKHFHTKNFPVSLAHFDTNVITQKLCFPVQLKETYNVHRMTGLAFVLLDDNCVRFCLDTFYQGILTRHLLCIKLQDINLFKFLRGAVLFCSLQGNILSHFILRSISKMKKFG